MTPTALFELNGKTALVTGGATGIGRMATTALAAAGAQVFIASRKIDACRATADEINCLGFAGSVHAMQLTDSEVIKYSAAGFRDFTRIAASDPTMWRDVFLTNKDATLEILGRFTEELFALQRAIRTGDGEMLHDYFTRTRSIRRGIIEAGQDTDAPDFGRAKVDSKE